MKSLTLTLRGGLAYGVGEPGLDAVFPVTDVGAGESSSFTSRVLIAISESLGCNIFNAHIF